MLKVEIRTWSVFAVVLLTQLALACSPFIPGFRDIIAKTFHGKDPSDVQIALTGLYAGLLTIFIGVAYAAIRRHLDTTRAQTEEALARAPIVKALRDDRFHDEFQVAARHAESQVWITNLAPSPDYFANRPRKRYLSALARDIKNMPSVRFRRLVRDTQDNQPWIAEMLKKFSGSSNIDIAMIEDSGDDEHPLAMSVQIIDDSDCWLVALSGHERTGPHRDVHVRDPGFAALASRYYDRLWNKATLLMQNGTVTARGEVILASPPRDRD